MGTLKGWVLPEGGSRQTLNLSVDIQVDNLLETIDLPGHGRIHIRWLTNNDGEGTLTWSATQQVILVRARRDPTRRQIANLYFFHHSTGAACGTCTLEELPSP